MQKTFIIVCTFLFNLVKAQSSFVGFVKDSLGRPVPQVSVQLNADGKKIAGVITDQKGWFVVPFPSSAKDHFQLAFSAIGFYTQILEVAGKDSLLPVSIMLKRVDQSLAAVTVTAKRSLVERRIDRSVINVENSFLSNGFSGLDVLQRAPGLWVDNAGNIKINGNRSVTVMINDIIQRMGAEELAEYLRTLRSEDISKIEIIQNPPSEYEASGSGGIIHIMLKRSARRGLDGNINTQYRQQGKRSMMRSGINLDYKRGNLYLTGGISAAGERRDIIERASIMSNENNYSANEVDRFENIFSHQYRLGLVYEFSQQHILGLQTMQTMTDFEQRFFAAVLQRNNVQDFTGFTTADKSRLFRFGSTTLNYHWKIDQLGSGLKIIADYSTNNKEESNLLSGRYSVASFDKTFRNYTPFVTDNLSLQADYSKQFQNKAAIKSGIKYASIKRDNQLIREDHLNNKWEINNEVSNQFMYTERLLMMYSSFEKSICSFSFKAGLRYEQTFSEGNSITTNQIFSRQYGGLFPSLFLLQHIDSAKGHSLYVNYSKRLQRPGLAELNPNRIPFSNYTAMKGDPDLQPQYTHNIAAGIKWKHQYQADLYLDRTVNVLTLRATTDSNNVILYQSANVFNTTEYGINISVPLTIMKGWTTINNFSLNHFFYRFDGVRFSQANFAARTIHNIALKSIVEVDMVIDYRSPYVYANLKNPSQFYFDVGFAKKVWKNKFRIRLAATDIFNTIREKEYTNNKGTIIQFYRKRPSRTFGFTLNYNFSAGKRFNKREINQGNAEERRRSGN